MFGSSILMPGIYIILVYIYVVLHLDI